MQQLKKVIGKLEAFLVQYNFNAEGFNLWFFKELWLVCEWKQNSFTLISFKTRVLSFDSSVLFLMSIMSKMIFYVEISQLWWVPLSYFSNKKVFIPSVRYSPLFFCSLMCMLLKCWLENRSIWVWIKEEVCALPRKFCNKY